MIGFPLQLPIEASTPRKWIAGVICGNVFGDDDDFDGLALTIQLHSAAEVKAVAAFLAGHAVAVPVAP